jgi:hypothetical protein
LCSSVARVRVGFVEGFASDVLFLRERHDVAFISQFHAKYHAKALGGYERSETGSTGFRL